MNQLSLKGVEMIIYSTKPDTMITPGEVAELRAAVVQLREENQTLIDENIRLENTITEMKLLIEKLRADNCTCHK